MAAINSFKYNKGGEKEDDFGEAKDNALAAIGHFLKF